ncbi:MAG TPA: polysaccharide lyase [Thermoanaerobaculia bacterium]|nr:polysaccharide lyase [Thermoanaerobaculia bacterium]
MTEGREAGHGMGRPQRARRHARSLALLAAGAAVAGVALAAAAGAPSRRGVWFCGDFESGDFRGWSWDLSRQECAVVVTSPVRKGRYAARITLAPGDRGAGKPRSELKIADKEIERAHGRQGSEIWYGWSLLIPIGYADPEDQFQILAQWHHRPSAPTSPTDRPTVTGPPPLALYLDADAGQETLSLVARATSASPPRTLATRQVRRGAWIDLVIQIRCSTGSDGFVAAWIDGKPFTAGSMKGPTLYTPTANYLRIGLYRGKGVQTTNSVYIDEVRVGDSYQAVAP